MQILCWEFVSATKMLEMCLVRISGALGSLEEEDLLISWEETWPWNCPGIEVGSGAYNQSHHQAVDSQWDGFVVILPVALALLMSLFCPDPICPL